MKAQRSKKWRRWRKFKDSGVPRDYDYYKMERNRLRDITWSAKVKYEKKSLLI